MKKKLFFIFLLSVSFAFFAILEDIKAEGCTYSFYMGLMGDSAETRKYDNSGVGGAYKDATIYDVKWGKNGDYDMWEGESESDLGVLGGHEYIAGYYHNDCPDYIGVFLLGGFKGAEWYGFTRKQVSDAGEQLGLSIHADNLFLYKNDNMKIEEGEPQEYTCSYDNFDILFSPEGIAKAAKEKYDSGFLYYLSEEMKNPVATPGKCEDVKYCISGNGTTNKPVYTIFSDELDYERNKSICQSTILTGEIFSGNTENYENTCRTYQKYIISLETYYPLCQGNKASCSEYYKIKDEIATLCNGLTKYADYETSNCLKSCLNLKEEIKRIEKNVFDDVACGLSERLILWIANIIRWVKYIVPVAVIILGILDFIKAIGADKEDVIKKAQQRFIKRLIAAGLIFIAPFIIEFILNKMGFDANGCGIINL